MHAAPLRRLCRRAAAQLLTTTARRASGSSSRQQLASSMAPKAATQYDQGWLDDWRSGVDPGTLWDAGGASPQLLQLLRSGQLVVRGKRTLVPGCGRGYDVCAFAAAGAALSVGLDLSPDATAAAAAECAKQLAGQPDAAASCQLVAGDFVTHSPPGGGGQLFDVGYDYTFLCALHPSMRQDWAAAWARLIAPGGLLVTLVFPTSLPASAPRRDPPWLVTPELYAQLLAPAGFVAERLEQVPGELSHKARAGREWLGVWRRQGQVAAQL